MLSQSDEFAVVSRAARFGDQLQYVSGFHAVLGAAEERLGLCIISSASESLKAPRRRYAARTIGNSLHQRRGAAHSGSLRKATRAPGVICPRGGDRLPRWCQRRSWSPCGLDRLEMSLGQWGKGQPLAPCIRSGEKCVGIDARAQERLLEPDDDLTVEAASVIRGALFQPFVQFVGDVLERDRRHISTSPSGFTLEPFWFTG